MRKSGIRLTENLKMDPKDIKTCTISIKNGKYYVTITYEVQRISKLFKQHSVGIDLGVETFATLATKQDVYFEEKIRKSELKSLKEKISYLQRKQSLKTKGSKGWHKLLTKINACYEKMNNIKKDTLHKITTKIAKRFKYIGIEDLRVSNLVKNHNIAESIFMQNWYQFRQMLTYKSELYGSTLVVAPKTFASTQICSHCGNQLTGKNKLKLSDRTYTCKCGFILDRDKNAARNLKIFADIFAGQQA